MEDDKHAGDRSKRAKATRGPIQGEVKTQPHAMTKAQFISALAFRMFLLDASEKGQTKAEAELLWRDRDRSGLRYIWTRQAAGIYLILDAMPDVTLIIEEKGTSRG